MRHVGLLGGTFDPVHDGHVQLALAARDEMRLDQVLLIPAADPPHKELGEITDFQHRQAMLRLALAGQSNLSVCLVEDELPHPSYTVSTIRHLREISGKTVRYYFIVGVDAFADLLTWRDFQGLLRAVDLIVAPRIGFNQWQKLDEIALTLRYKREKEVWSSSCGLQHIHFLTSTPKEISSSSLRGFLNNGKSPISGLHPDVLNYMKAHRLYGFGSDA